MKHAKRMVLVPEDVLNRYEQQEKLETSPNTANMMYQDTEMSEFFKRAKMGYGEWENVYIFRAKYWCYGQCFIWMHP
jgi:hypothetical protein